MFPSLFFYLFVNCLLIGDFYLHEEYISSFNVIDVLLSIRFCFEYNCLYTDWSKYLKSPLLLSLDIDNGFFIIILLVWSIILSRSCPISQAIYCDLYRVLFFVIVFYISGWNVPLFYSLNLLIGVAYLYFYISLMVVKLILGAVFADLICVFGWILSHRFCYLTFL